MYFHLIFTVIVMLAHIFAGPYEPVAESTGRMVTEELCIEECEADCSPKDYRNDDELQECKDGCQCGCAGFPEDER